MICTSGPLHRLRAQLGERRVGQPTTEIGPQQELAMPGDARDQRQETVSPRPSPRAARHRPLRARPRARLETAARLGRIARADVADADERRRVLRGFAANGVLLGMRRVHARRWRWHVGHERRRRQRLGGSERIAQRRHQLPRPAHARALCGLEKRSPIWRFAALTRPRDHERVQHARSSGRVRPSDESGRASDNAGHASRAFA